MGAAHRTPSLYATTTSSKAGELRFSPVSISADEEGADADISRRRETRIVMAAPS